MRRAVALVLACCFLGLGSGLAEYLHNVAHARQDAALASIRLASPDSDRHSPSKPGPVHDESNCRLHALLHAPLASIAYAPVLICLGLFVTVAPVAAVTPFSLRLPLRLDCRGPPAF